MVKNALVRALRRVLVLVFAPKTSRTVPMKEVVGERARRSGSGSPFSLLILFQWRRVNEAATAAEEAAVSTPWRTRTTMMVVPTSAFAHQPSSCCVSEYAWAHVVVKVTMMMAQKSTDDAATKAVCQKRPSKRILLGARRRERSNVEVRNHFCRDRKMWRARLRLVFPAPSWILLRSGQRRDAQCPEPCDGTGDRSMPVRRGPLNGGDTTARGKQNASRLVQPQQPPPESRHINFK